MYTYQKLTVRQMFERGPTRVGKVVPGVGKSCRCRIHTVVDCGHDGELGCRGQKPGTHPAVVALYSSGVSRRACHVQAGQAVLDQRFAGLVLRDAFLGAANVNPKGWEPASRYDRGAPIPVSEMGAGYCFLHAIKPTFRMRVARVLGSLAYVVDVMRAVKIAGLSAGPFLTLRKVGPAMAHVEPVLGTYDTRAGFHFFGALVRFVREEGLHAVIGVSSPSEAWEVVREREPFVGVQVAPAVAGGVRSPSFHFGQRLSRVVVSEEVMNTHVRIKRVHDLLAWLDSSSAGLPEEVAVELAVVTCAPALLPVELGCLRERVRVMVIVGDVVLKQSAIVAVVGHGSHISDYAHYLSDQEDAKLAVWVEGSVLRGFLHVGDMKTGSKAWASIFKAMIGVLWYRTGEEGVARVLGVLGRLPGSGLPVEDVVVPEGSANSVDGMLRALGQLSVEDRVKFLRVISDQGCGAGKPASGDA